MDDFVGLFLCVSVLVDEFAQFFGDNETGIQGLLRYHGQVENCFVKMKQVSKDYFVTANKSTFFAVNCLLRIVCCELFVANCLLRIVCGYFILAVLEVCTLDLHVTCLMMCNESTAVSRICFGNQNRYAGQAEICFVKMKQVREQAKHFRANFKTGTRTSQTFFAVNCLLRIVCDYFIFAVLEICTLDLYVTYTMLCT